jgi:uncharacterized protein YyaL (SSP411 family)
VDWFAWGEEAFAKARTEQKPIFLSIGYSTCHWCHVMERESFENAAVARFLNDHFVSIKVDREERPDVDKIYMTFVQATTGGGGWPLNVFLTPELKPFYGGTYFPPSSHHGRASFLDVLQQLRRVWEDRRGEVTDSATETHRRLQDFVGRQAAAAELPGESVLGHAAAQLKADYDPNHGGFGGAPKFPRPSHPLFLLRWAKRAGDLDALRMVLHTCDRMAEGGIYDQLGGGFSRYSVDAEWLVPHFEKMLYDNAQLVQLYLEAFLAGGEARHATVARDILNYVLRDMTHPEGGFYSAEDADSEGKEGKFYCWTLAELRGALAPAEFALVVRHFGITQGGNFVDHSDPDPLPGQNVLSIVDPALTIAEAPLLDAAKAKLLALRSRRVRPHLDDKVLASWNGLMLGALARAAVLLDDARLREAAAKNLAFLRSRLWDASTGTLYHRWREGERDAAQLLDAYAFLLSGTLDLYESTLEPANLDFAVSLADAMLAKFFDAEAGGFWQSPPGTQNLILSVKEDYDGAEPSGNSVAVLALLKLADITGKEPYREAAEKSLRLFSARLHQLPQAVPCMLSGLEYATSERRRVVIAGSPAQAGFQELLKAAHATYRPDRVVLGNAGAVDVFARQLPTRDGCPTAYVCTGVTCQAPVQSPAALIELLG